MLLLEKEIECQLSQMSSSIPLCQTVDDKIIAIENISTVIHTIEKNYSEQNYEIFNLNEQFSSCLYEVQTKLTGLYTNLPLAVTKKAAILVSKIQAILMRTGFINLISILPTEITCKHMIPCMSTSQNKYTSNSLTGKEYKAFACTSKKSNKLVRETNEEWQIEHVKLQAQNSDVKSKGFKSCEEAIAYTIEKGYTVLDLKGFKDVTDEIIEKLFKDYPNLHHFMVNSNKITKLPDCSQLQTLICDNCTALTSLPLGMVNLAELSCDNCTALTSLPAGMVNLAVLSCEGCTALSSLPAGMVNLVVLNCRDCQALIALPAGMVKLAQLNCGGCIVLTSLPVGLVNLVVLNCYDCTALTSLPAGMVNLAQLSCNGCTALISLPVGLVKLAGLNCYYCTGLKITPKDIPTGCHIFR